MRKKHRNIWTIEPKKPGECFFPRSVVKEETFDWLTNGPETRRKAPAHFPWPYDSLDVDEGDELNAA
jgi:hypothetical protein